MMALGDLYAEAQGVSRSMSQALAWYELAAERGIAEAVAKRDGLTRSLPEGDVDQANTIAAAWQPQPDATPLPEAVPPLPAAAQQPSLLPGAAGQPAGAPPAPAPDPSGQPAIPNVLPTMQDTGLPGGAGAAPGAAPSAIPPVPDSNQPVELPTAPQPAPASNSAPAATPAATDSGAPADNTVAPAGSPQPGAKPFDAGNTTIIQPSPVPAAALPAVPAAPAAATPAPADENAAPAQLIGTPQPGAKPFGADSKPAAQPKPAAAQTITIPGTPAPAPAPAPATGATPTP